MAEFDLQMEFPALFTAAEKVSAESQRRFLAARAIEFALLVVSAGFGEIPRDSISDAGSWIAVISFAAALVIRLSGVGDKSEKRWYDARAAAESIKSSAWQFAVGGNAFPLSETSADERFRQELSRILGLLPNLNVPAGPGNRMAVTDGMRDLRSRSRGERGRCYQRDRVVDQQNWYSQKATTNHKMANVWRWIVAGVDSAAILLGLLRIFGAFDVNWLGILAAAAAGAAGWQQIKNYSSLSEAYSVTSQEVALVSESVENANDDEGAWAQLVHDAEAAFSREHTLWLARRTRPANPI